MNEFWRRHPDKIGVIGSTFAALCCLGVPSLLALLSAIGLGFLIRDAVLIPMLVVFLAISAYGPYDGMRRHGNRLPLAVEIGAAVLLLASIWFGSGIAAGVGIAGLIAASLSNLWLAVRPSS